MSQNTPPKKERITVRIQKPVLDSLDARWGKCA